MLTVETIRNCHVCLFDDAEKYHPCGREGVVQTCGAMPMVLRETDEEREEGTEMINNQLTDERISELLECATVYDLTEFAKNDDLALALHELRERRKASMDCRLSAEQSEVRNILPEEMNIGRAMRCWGGGHGSIESFVAGYNTCRAATIHAKSAPERELVRQEHAEWSQSTFGNVGPIGPLKHLSKEALEAAAEPGDLSEWADMQFLLWDAQRRAGITDEQMTLAMIEKLAVNKQSEWPEPKDGEPQLHIKERSALVLPEEITLEKVAEMTAARGTEYSIRDSIIAAKWWNDCCAAMLNGGKP